MTRLAKFSLFSIALLLGGGALLAQPTENGLVQAWEAVQRSDAETTAFEKRPDGSYHFATRRFPFEGELKMLKATVEDAHSGQFVPGVIEVELVGLPDKVTRDYARSYAYWASGNNLYYDTSSKRWLSFKDFQAAIRRPGNWIRGMTLWSFLPTLLLGLFFLLLLFMIARAQARQRAYAKRFERSSEISERMLKLSESSAQTMEKILANTQRRQEAYEQRFQRISERSERALQMSEKNAQSMEKMLELASQSQHVLNEILEELRQRPR